MPKTDWADILVWLPTIIILAPAERLRLGAELNVTFDANNGLKGRLQHPAISLTLPNSIILSSLPPVIYMQSNYRIIGSCTAIIRDQTFLDTSVSPCNTAALGMTAPLRTWSLRVPCRLFKLFAGTNWEDAACACRELRSGTGPPWHQHARGCRRIQRIDGANAFVAL